MAPDKEFDRVSRRSDDLRGITSTVYDRSYPLYEERLPGILTTRPTVSQTSLRALEIENLGRIIDGNSSYGTRSYGNTSYGNSAYNNASYNNTTYGNTTYGDTTYGSQTYNPSYQTPQLQEYTREPQRRDQLFRLDDLTEVRFETRPSSSKKGAKKSRH